MTQQPAPSEVEPLVFAERVRILYDNLLTGQVVTVIVALAVAVLARLTAGDLLAGSWATAMIAVALIRGAMLYAYRTAAHGPARARFWYHLFHAGLGAVSLLWVAGSILLLPGLDTGPKTAMLMVLVGMTAGAIAVLGADRGAYLLYAAALMLPASIMLGLAADVHHKILGMLGCAYFVAMLVASNRYYVTLHQSLTLAFLNAKLVDNIDARELREAGVRADLQRALKSSRADHDKLAQVARAQHALDAQRAAFAAAAAQDARTLLKRIADRAAQPAAKDAGAPQTGQTGSDAHLIAACLCSIADVCNAAAPAPERVPFQPGTLIAAVGELLAPSAQQRGCSLSLVIDPGLPGSLYGDPARFSQIVMTMAGGMTQLAASGDIKIDARVIARKPQHVLLRLTIGAAADALPHGATEEMQRLLRQNDVQASALPSTALTGIQTARRWVESMNGRIGVDLRGRDGPCLWAELQLDTA